MSNLPEPLTPADCDLRGLEYMPFHGARLYDSDFNARASDAEFRAAMALWWASWQQLPGASLPDDDIVLCRLADLGRDQKAWKRVKAMALHNFVLCSDGRFYHRFLSPQALIAWDKRVAERARKAKWRAAKTGTSAGLDDAGDGDKPPLSPSPSAFRDGSVPADGNRRDVTGIKKEEDDVEARAGARAIDPPANAFNLVKLADDACRAGGVRNIDPGRIAGHVELVREWQEAGADPPLIIDAIRAAVAVAAEPVHSLKFFAPAVRQAIAKKEGNANVRMERHDRLPIGGNVRTRAALDLVRQFGTAAQRDQSGDSGPDRGACVALPAGTR